MRIMIVDDEPLARERLRRLLSEIGAPAPVAEAQNGLDAIELADRVQPDVVLLDLRMPLMDGLEAARHLASAALPPVVVFCTAYDDQALAAFEAGAVDYLLKPVRAERLQAALKKAERYLGQDLRPRSEVGGQGPRTHLCARLRGGLKLIRVSDVAYFLADAKYVEVHAVNGQTVLIEDSLVSLEQEFGERFVRIHRSCLVARDRIEALVRGPQGEMRVQLRGVPETLDVSRRSLAAVRKLVRTM